jgi:hypothetical protein
VNQEQASYTAKRLAKEVAVEIAAASSDPETDEIAADVANASVHDISDAHVNALVLAAIKHLTPWIGRRRVHRTVLACRGYAVGRLCSVRGEVWVGPAVARPLGREGSGLRTRPPRRGSQGRAGRGSGGFPRGGSREPTRQTIAPHGWGCGYREVRGVAVSPSPAPSLLLLLEVRGSILTGSEPRSGVQERIM